MTYCVAMSLDEGMLFASDSRTNAGVDQVSTFCKMTVLELPGERVIVLLNAGNLATTQATINAIKTSDEAHSVLRASSMFQVAERVGETLKSVIRRTADGGVQQSDVDFSASFLVGGQIKGEAPRLFLVYAQGNFIEATAETPFLQIGESKYGKPILDRVIKPQTPLSEAVKCALVSFDSTIKSNLSVGLPIDLVLVRHNALRINLRQRIGSEDTYFHDIRDFWGKGLKRVFNELPEPAWLHQQG